MELDQRSYSGKLFRPKPSVYFDPRDRILIVATAWGSTATGERVIEHLKSFLLSTKNDAEVTSPFENLSVLSPMANNLRAAMMMANDLVFQEENQNEFQSGLELTVLFFDKHEVALAHCGMPWVFLDRPGLNLTPLCGSPDASLLWTEGKTLSPPLPQELLGLHDRSSLTLRTFRTLPQDRIILVSRSQIPPEFYSQPRKTRGLHDLSTALASTDGDSPFWLGILSNLSDDQHGAT